MPSPSSRRATWPDFATRENVNLKKKIENFHRQLADLSPPTSGLDEISHKILTALFYNGEYSVESLAQTAGIFEGLAKYHLDDLKKEGMIQRTLLGGVSFDALSSSATYDLTPKGREYVVKNLLKNSRGEPDPRPKDRSDRRH